MAMRIIMARRNAMRAVFAVLSAVFSCAAWNMCYADDRKTAFDILDAWTCVRWGEDNIAWVVHYPEELVDPWVSSEAEKQKLRPEQADELRKSFSEELRIGSATAVLLYVYGYGASPVNLSPMGKNIALIDSSGKRVSPIVFEKKLDGPISGLVQGFIFFPLQADKNFRIAVKGLIPDRETSFAFSEAAGGGGSIATLPPESVATTTKRTAAPEREVVVKIPTRREPAEKPEEPMPPEPGAIETPEFGDTGEVFPPTEPVVPEPAAAPKLPDEEKKQDAPKLAPRQVLEIYLKAWIDGDVDKMYSLLSAESQGRVSRELFARDVASGNFRSALRSGYKVSWTDDSARVTVAKKVLFVRTLETKQINFVMEDGSARVSW
ncbi:MAG: hypothetical protein LBU26_01220 [Synergistaceae bacterium]|jgi:hypothetical protein|nr:hypothetical protein [Synergistaceae bacterium]